jgi:hypothetical protein
MGTPHQGGNGVALGKLLVNIASVFVPADNRLLQHLERDSEWLQQQLRQYGPINTEFVTKFAYEVYETPTAMGHSLMVSNCSRIDTTVTEMGRSSLEHPPWCQVPQMPSRLRSTRTIRTW